MAKVRSKIFARERVEVDGRTPGIRPAAHGGNALGDMRSSSVIYVPSGGGTNIWSNLSASLGNLVNGITAQMRRQEAEEERARAKAEREAEKAAAKAERAAERQLEALETTKAFEFALNLRKDLSDGMAKGEISSSDQLFDLTRSRMDEMKGSASPAFFEHAWPKVYSIVTDAQERLAAHAQRNFEAELYGQATDGLSKALDNYDPDDAASSQMVTEAFATVQSLGASAGKADVEIDAVKLQSIQRAIKRAAYKNPERVPGLVHLAETIPGGAEAAAEAEIEADKEILILDEQRRSRLHRDDTERVNEQRFFNQARLSGLTVEKLQDERQRLIDNLDDTRSLYGDLAPSVIEDYDRAIEALRNKDIKAEQDRLQDSAKKMYAFAERIKKGEEVSSAEMGNSGMDSRHVVELLQLTDESERKDRERRQPMVESLWEEFVRRVPFEASFQYPKDSQGRPAIPAELEALIKNKIDDALRSVRPPDPTASSEDYGSFINSRAAAGRQIIEDTLGKKYNLGWQEATTGKERTLQDKASFIPAAKIESDPDERKRFKEALISGTGEFVTNKYTDSGRPLKSTINWEFYNSLTPDRQEVAKNILAQHAVELRAERQKIPERGQLAALFLGSERGAVSKFIFGEPLSQDELDEAAWRDERMRNAADMVPDQGYATFDKRLEATRDWEKYFDQFTPEGNRKPVAE